MRIKIITKDFGIITTASVPYSEGALEEMTTQLEFIGDECHSGKASFTLKDEKGNIIVLNPFILRKSVYMIEMQPPDLIPTPPGLKSKLP